MKTFKQHTADQNTVIKAVYKDSQGRVSSILSVYPATKNVELHNTSGSNESLSNVMFMHPYQGFQKNSEDFYNAVRNCTSVDELVAAAKSITKIKDWSAA